VVIGDGGQHSDADVDPGRASRGREPLDSDGAIDNGRFPASGEAPDNKLDRPGGVEAAVELDRDVTDPLEVEPAVGALAGRGELPGPAGVGPLDGIPPAAALEPGEPRLLPRAEAAQEVAEEASSRRSSVP
jgi:hypothetical protein